MKMARRSGKSLFMPCRAQCLSLRSFLLRCTSERHSHQVVYPTRHCTLEYEFSEFYGSSIFFDEGLSHYEKQVDALVLFHLVGRELVPYSHSPAPPVQDERGEEVPC